MSDLNKDLECEKNKILILKKYFNPPSTFRKIRVCNKMSKWRYSKKNGLEKNDYYNGWQSSTWKKFIKKIRRINKKEMKINKGNDLSKKNLIEGLI